MMFWVTLIENGFCEVYTNWASVTNLSEKIFKKTQKKIIVSHYFFLSEVTLPLSYQIPKSPDIGIKRKKIVLQNVTTPDSFS